MCSNFGRLESNFLEWRLYRTVQGRNPELHRWCSPRRIYPHLWGLRWSFSPCTRITHRVRLRRTLSAGTRDTVPISLKAIRGNEPKNGWSYLRFFVVVRDTTVKGVGSPGVTSNGQPCSEAINRCLHETCAGNQESKYGHLLAPKRGSSTSGIFCGYGGGGGSSGSSREKDVNSQSAVSRMGSPRGRGASAEEGVWGEISGGVEAFACSVGMLLVRRVFI